MSKTKSIVIFLMSNSRSVQFIKIVTANVICCTDKWYPRKMSEGSLSKGSLVRGFDHLENHN